MTRARLLLVVALAGASGCTCTSDVFQRMESQPKYLPYQESELFEDGRAMRTPPEGTVPVATDEPAHMGQYDFEAHNALKNPRPMSLASLKNGEIHLVFNTTDGAQALADSMSIRRTALTLKVPYYTTMAGAAAATQAIAALQSGSLEVAPLQSYSN